jgi:hypothetical protein
MIWWKPKNKIPENEIVIDHDDLDKLLVILRCWYGIEVDSWINSEASRYANVLRITNFSGRSEAIRLHLLFHKAIRKTKPGQPGGKPSDVLDFKRAVAGFVKNVVKGRSQELLEIRRKAPSCKEHYPLAKWLFFLDESAYRNCRFEVILEFEPFGSKSIWNVLTLELRSAGSGNLLLKGFHTLKKRFEDLDFLVNGLEIFKQLKKQAADEDEDIKFRETYSRLDAGWFKFTCKNEDEAMVLDGLNKTLGLNSSCYGTFVKFQAEENDIPALISYLRAGLPHNIFTYIEPEDMQAGTTALPGSEGL